MAYYLFNVGFNMSEFFFQYGLFFAKVITGLFAVMILLSIIAASKQKQSASQLKITHLNDKFTQLKQQVLQLVLDKPQWKSFQKEEKKQQKANKKQQKHLVDKPKSKLYVIAFQGDIKASGVEVLRDEVTAILAVAKPQDEVLLKLENYGGAVHEHGLAASQLVRLKRAKLHLTVSVDRVAASGGYLMACIADKIIAAPFAILGSIGVIAQIPNFHRVLDKAGVDFEQHTAGEFKRTVTMFGKNTDKEREKLASELQEVHTLFRDFVVQYRAKLDIDTVATGEHWLGEQALTLNLIDSIQTSDEFLMQSLGQYDMYQIEMQEKKKLVDRVFSGVFLAMDKLQSRYVEQSKIVR